MSNYGKSTNCNIKKSSNTYATNNLNINTISKLQKSSCFNHESRYDKSVYLVNNIDSNNLRFKIMAVESNINEISDEFNIHKSDVLKILSEKDKVVYEVDECKKQLINECNKKYEEVKNKIEENIKSQNNKISSLEDNIKILNKEKEELINIITELKFRVVDLERQIGYNT